MQLFGVKVSAFYRFCSIIPARLSNFAANYIILYMIDTTIFQNKKAVYYTLGCKLNFAETSTIGKMLKEAGVRTVRPGEKADICIVNTCSVTEVADKKCRRSHSSAGEKPSRCFCGSDGMLCSAEAGAGR